SNPLYCLINIMKPILALLLVLASHLAFGQSPNDKVTQAMNEAMKSSDLPSVVAIAVNTKGEQLTYSYGKAIWTGNEAVTPKHMGIQRPPHAIRERHAVPVWNKHRLGR